MAPPFDFLVKSFLPLVNRMGPTVTAELERSGFYPAGGGRFSVSITPATRLLPLEMLERGAIRSIKARAVVANLWRSIAIREANLVGRLLSLSDDSLIVEEIQGALGPGNAVTVEIETAYHTEVFTGFGEVNVRAEGVAAKVAQEARAYIASGVPIGIHLADQLLIPVALAGVGRFRTGPLSRHTTTNLEVIHQFLDVEFDLLEEPKRIWTISVAGTRN
jgi:RNA 3'-terminal phosphate cyclase (ATP)